MMSTRRTYTINSTALYIIVAVIIVVAFLLLGGGLWMKGMMNGNSMIYTSHWNWLQIIISLGIGFLLGLAVAKKK